jgi:phytoene/squalene synthetase
MRHCLGMGNLALVTRPMRDSDPPASDPGDARGGSGAQGTGEPRSAASAAGPDDTPRMLSPSRYLAWLYSPEAQQPVLAKLCEIESEIAGSLRPGIDHHVAHARLQWWQEECERCAQGRPVHPLTRELVKAYGAPAAGQPSPLTGLSGFVDTAVWDLAGATFETRKELTAYCERWAAAMFEVAAASERQPAEAAHAARATQAALMMQASDASGSAAPSVGATTAVVSAASDADPIAAAQAANTAPSVPRATSAWRVLGAAVREIELLANLAREAHGGRVRVPLDELDRVGVPVNGLAKPPWPAPLASLLRERHEALRATLGASLAGLGRDEQAGFRGLLVWASLAWQQSARAQRALPGIILPRRYHALVDGWQAWRAARRSAAGKLQLS